MGWLRKEKKNRVLVLIDWENLFLNAPLETPGGVSITQRIDTLIHEIIPQEIGRIIGVFVFAPPHSILRSAETFHKLGFFPILCPKVEAKGGGERDTADETLIRAGEVMIEHIEGLTHLCLGSGDIDFSGFLREAKRNGLQISIVTGSLSSLASELIGFAEKVDSKRRVYDLSQIE